VVGWFVINGCDFGILGVGGVEFAGVVGVDWEGM